MNPDRMPESDLDRHLRHQRHLGWLVLVLGGTTGVCFLLQWMPGFLFCLVATAIALFAWWLSPPCLNPFDPD